MWQFGYGFISRCVPCNSFLIKSLRVSLPAFVQVVVVSKGSLWQESALKVFTI